MRTSIDIAQVLNLKGTRYKPTCKFPKSSLNVNSASRTRERWSAHTCKEFKSVGQRSHTISHNLLHFLNSEVKISLRSHSKISLNFSTPPAPVPPMTTVLFQNYYKKHTLMFPSFLRPAIGSKELLATSPHAAFRQQHDTDCTIHKEPAMLQTPWFKHSDHGLQGLA